MKKHFLFLLMASFQLFFGFAQQDFNLTQCIVYAQSHNIQVKQLENQAAVDQQNYIQSKNARYPLVYATSSTEINAGRVINPNSNLIISQNIFGSFLGIVVSADVYNFGRVQHTMAANRYAAAAALALIEKLQEDLVRQVAGAYLQVLLNRQQREISAVHIRQTADELSNARKLVKAGVLPPINELQLQVQLAQDSSNLVTVQGIETQALLQLKALLGMDPAMPFNIKAFQVDQFPVPSILELQPEAIYRLAQANSPQQRATALLIKSEEENKNAAVAALRPALALNGNLRTSFSNADDQAAFTGISKSVDPPGRQLWNNIGSSFGVTISIQIFGGPAHANLQRTKLRKQAYELQQQQENITLKQDIYKDYNDAATLMKKLNVEARGLEAAKAATNLASMKYRAGLLTTLELITSRNNLYNIKLQQVMTQYECIFKIKMLEFYKGQGLKM